MNDLQVFTNEQFGNVRVLNMNGELLFCGKDVLDALSYSENSNPSKAFKAVPDVWKGMYPIHTPGGNQSMLCLSEQGLYFFLGRSDKSKALPYQMYIAGEVVPSIRKHGGYISGQENLSDDELLAKALIVAQSKIAERDKRIQEQEKLIEEQKPLVEFANHVGDASDVIDIGTLAKLVNKSGIDIGRNRLFKWLRERKILMKGNIPYQEYVNRGYFKLIEKENKTAYGPDIYVQTFVTGKGQIWIVEKLREEIEKKD